MGWRETIFGADGKTWEEKIAREKKLADTPLEIQEFGKPETRRAMTGRERKRYGYPPYKGR